MRHFFVLALILPTSLFAEDWPQFLGPRRDGSYQGKALPTWPAEGPKKIWRMKIGSGFAGPVVADGQLFIFHRTAGREVLECADATTGKTLWKYQSPADYVDDFGFDDGPRAVPTVSAGRVFTLGANGLMKCNDAKTGKVFWKVDVRKQFEAGKGFFGLACSPLISDRNVLINIGGRSAGIIALDTQSGKIQWKATEEKSSYASPILTKINEQAHAIFFYS